MCMYVCMYVYVCVCMYVCMCMYVYIYIYIYRERGPLLRAALNRSHDKIFGVYRALLRAGVMISNRSNNSSNSDSNN